MSSSHAGPPRKTAWARMRLWACGNEVGFGRRHRAGTGVLLDLCAMLKSLFAALTILHLLRSDLISCYDGYLYAPAFVIPAWFMQQQCDPTLELDTSLQLFTACIVLNQLTFLVTSFITHFNPCNILAHSRTRAALGYFLGLCSFLFGFCKIGIIVGITTTSEVKYPCIFPAPELTDRDNCYNKQFLVPSTFSVSNQDRASPCLCTFKIPPEVLVLSTTFALTFMYSVFMVDQLMHRRPEEEAREEAADERRRAELEQDRIDAQEAEDESYQQAPESIVHRKSHSSSPLGQALLAEPQPSYSRSPAAAAGAAPVASGSAVSVSSFVEMDSGFDAERSISKYGDGANIELSQPMQSDPSDAGAYSGAVKRSAGRSSRANPEPLVSKPVSARNDASSSDMVALDPLTLRALEVAGTLTSQQLLLATVESDLRKHLSNELRSRDLIYRLIRDSATLVKFMVTIVSLSLILYNVGGSIISCGRSSDLAADIAADITPSIVMRSCAPRIASNSLAFLFSVIGVVVASLFIVIIIVEKRVLLPASAKWLSAFLLSGVALLLFVQLLLMVEIEDSPLSFPCSSSYTLENQTVTEWSVCRDHNITISHQPVDCRERCEVALGFSTYLLFASLVLSLVYLASLVMRYQDLARIMTATRVRMDTEMARLLQPKSAEGQGKAQENIDPKQVVLAILAKY